MDDAHSASTGFFFSLRRGRGLRVLGILLLLAGPLALTTALLFGRGMFSGNRPAGELVVSAQHLAVGRVWTNANFTCALPIKNTTNRPIDITAFRISCNCTRVDPPAMTIAPHATSELTVAIDLTNKHIRNRAKSENPFSVTITPISSSLRSRPPDWELSGVAKETFACDPAELNVGDVPSGERLAPRQVRVTAATPLQDLSAATINGMTARVVEERPDGLHYSIAVGSLIALAPGQLNETIWLDGVDKDGKQLPRFPLPISANVLFDVEVQPSTILFGMQPVGVPCEALLEARSRAGKPFELKPAEQDPGVDVKFDDSNMGQERIVRVRLSPEKQGDKQTSARIGVKNLATGEKTILTIPIFYYGTEPAAAHR